jgi:hypothetical protein
MDALNVWNGGGESASQLAQLSNPVLTLSALTVLVISHDSTVCLHPRYAVDGHEVADCPSFPMRPALAYSSSTRESEMHTSKNSEVYRALNLVLLHSVCKELWVCADGKAEKFYGDGALSASLSFAHQDLSLIDRNMPSQSKSTRRLSSVATRRCGRPRCRFFLPVAEMFLATRTLQHAQRERHRLRECIAATPRRASVSSACCMAPWFCVLTRLSETVYCMSVKRENHSQRPKCG